MSSFLKPSFSGGEISPALYSRVDLTKYQTGLALCRNFFVQAHGGVTNRAGLEICGEVKSSSSVHRLIPFQFNTTDRYALEFGNLTMRVVKNGAHVLEATKAITGISQANPCVVTVVGHGYSNGDEVYLDDIGGMTELNGRNVIITSLTANTFSIADRSGTNINSTSFTTYTSGGTAAKFYQIATPYPTADLDLLKYVQSADVMTLTHPSYAPRNLSRTADNNWALSTISFTPEISAPGAPIVTPVTTGSTTYSYCVTAVADTGEESLASGTTPITNGNAVANNTITWSAVSGAVSYVIYKQGDGLMGFIGRSTTLTFTDSNVAPDETDSPQTLNNPFDAADKYPGCSTFHEERKWFGRTNNKRQSLFASQPGAYNNMNKSIPTKDDDSIEAALVSRQVHEIRHLLSLGDLLVLTSGGEWIAKPGGQSDAITPGSLVVKPQSYRGSSHVPPIVVGNIALFVQDRGQMVRDLGYQYDVDKYTGNDLTLLSRHLFEGREIKEWGFAQAPYSIIWCVMDDGALLSLTYLREHEVWAWARHDTDGEFESVCVISEDSEDVPYFIVKRTIGGQTRRYIERMRSRIVSDVQDAFFVDSGLSLDEPVAITGITSANPPVVTTGSAHGLATGDLVDIEGTEVANPDYPAVDGSEDRLDAHATDGQRYKVEVLTSTTFRLKDYVENTNVDGSAWTAWLQGGNVRKAVTTLSGLHHLEGKTVSILANGDVQPLQAVSSGAITLDRAASRVHVGLPYTCDVQTLRLEATADGQLQGKKKSIPFVTVRMERTRGLAGGPRSTHLKEMKVVLTAYNAPAGLVTDDYKLSVPGDWSTGGQLFFRQSYPLPATILGLIPEVVVGGH